MKRFQTMASLATVGALLAIPTVAGANHGVPHGKSDGAPHGKAKGKTKTGSKCVVHKGFTVKGTLAGYTPDNPLTTNVNESIVTLTVTGQNRHARRSGLTDSDGTTAGLQYKVTHADDAFRLQLSDFEAGESPEVGEDTVRVVGKVAVTKRKCEPNASVEDRYDAVDVRKVKIVDAD